MIKICIITTVHPLFDTRIFYKEAKTLLGAGYDVTLIAQHDRNEKIDGINVIALKKPQNRRARIFSLGKNAYDLALRQGAAVYHFHDPELLPWMVRLKKTTGAKIIYDIHENVSKDILSKEWIPFFLRKAISVIFGFYEKSVSFKMDYLIAATPDIASGFEKDKLAIVSNYPIIFNDREQKEPENKLESRTLVYVGAIDKARGIGQIVLSLKFINPKLGVKLKIAGIFSEAYFEKEMKALPQWKEVDFMGFVPQKKARVLMKSAAIGLVCFLPVPNHINAMPNKIFEYMSAGIPVIASDFPLWKEIVEGNECGLNVDPENPRKIARAIEYLIFHPVEARKMGENGRRAVLNKYNWEKESEKLLKIYEQLLRK